MVRLNETLESGPDLELIRALVEVTESADLIADAHVDFHELVI